MKTNQESITFRHYLMNLERLVNKRLYIKVICGPACLSLYIITLDCCCCFSAEDFPVTHIACYIVMPINGNESLFIY